MGFSRQEYWSGLPFPSPGDLPNPGIKPRSPALEADALTSEPPGKTIPKKGNGKKKLNYCTTAHISCPSKVMLKILQTRCQQCMNHEIPDVQAGFRKRRGTKGQIANICWIIENAREFWKTSISVVLTTPKPLTVWTTTNCGTFLKRWGYQTTLSASWEICITVKKQQLELDMVKQTGFKLGKE